MDKDDHVLAVAIIDFIRQYTWDKQLETWVKGSGILGGGGKVRHHHTTTSTAAPELRLFISFLPLPCGSGRLCFAHLLG